MSYFRSYFEKNNTIIKNTNINTAKNPTTEIFYGTGFSKFLFKVDFTDLKSKVDNGDYVVDGYTKHMLRLTNTIFGDETFKGAKRSAGRERATSFDLILFKIPEFWDEGIGFDYEDTGYDYTTGNVTFSELPSNWYDRTTLDTWTTDGIYSTAPEIINVVHFDNGTEDIDVDITSYVNDIIVSGQTDYGIGIAFSEAFQDVIVNVDKSVAFFSKYTQTFYEPYVETIFYDRIDDDRQTFINNAVQNLYLYVTNGTNFYDLDELPIVDIYDSTNTIIPTLSGITATKIRKGIYVVTFGIEGLVCDGKRFFYDKWSNIKIDGNTLDDVTQKFVPKPYTNNITIGANPMDTTRYVIQYYGIKQNEKIIRGDNRKIVVYFKSFDDRSTKLFKEAYYRIYIKEGHTNVIVHDWTLLDVTNENSFTLNTGIYIPREYFIEIKAKTHGEEIFYKDEIKFEILSEK